MTFAAPTFLWLLPLALLPVILHLCFRRKKRTVDFSTLIFLTQGEKHLAMRRHIREWLTLLLRCLILFFLFLALAHPRLRHIALGSQSRTDAIIIIDDGLSMQRITPSGQSAFQCALKRSEMLLETMNKYSAVGIVRFSGLEGLPLSTSHQSTIAFLHNLEPTACGGNLTEALNRALSMLQKSGGANREIHILSDFRANSLPGKMPMALNNKNDLPQIYLYPLVGKEDNLRVTCTMSKSTPGLRQPMKIPYIVSSYGKDSPCSTTATLVINGQRIAQHTLNVPPNQSMAECFVYTPERNGRYLGYIEISDEALSNDNRCYFAFTVAPPYPILTLNGGVPNNPFYYMQKALAPTPGTARAICHAASINALTTESLSNKELVICAPGTTANESSIRLLADYIRRGGTMFLLPDSTNRFTESLRHVTNGELAISYASRKNNIKGIAFQGDLTYLNNLLQLDLIQWRCIYPMTLPANVQILAQNGEMPMLACIPYGNGALYAAAFNMRRADSNWPELKSFPIAIHAMADLFTGHNRKTAIIECGHALDTGSKEPLQWSDALNCPGSASDGVFPGLTIANAVAFDHGPYEYVICTASAEASVLTCANNKQLAGCFPSNTAIIAPNEDITQRLSTLRQGADFTCLALILAIVIALVEFMLGMESSIIPGRRS